MLGTCQKNIRDHEKHVRALLETCQKYETCQKNVRDLFKTYKPCTKTHFRIVHFVNVLVTCQKHFETYQKHVRDLYKTH